MPRLLAHVVLAFTTCAALAACDHHAPPPATTGPLTNPSGSGSGSASASGSGSGSAATPPVPAGDCGMKTTDWCPAPPGDPCGEHKDRASCQADPRCGGMAYRGESFVACHLDERGFADNCPTVGCQSLKH